MVLESQVDRLTKRWETTTDHGSVKYRPADNRIAMHEYDMASVMCN